MFHEEGSATNGVTLPCLNVCSFEAGKKINGHEQTIQISLLSWFVFKEVSFYSAQITVARGI